MCVTVLLGPSYTWTVMTDFGHGKFSEYIFFKNVFLKYSSYGRQEGFFEWKPHGTRPKNLIGIESYNFLV